MSAALNGTAVGLGALFPNFKEENPSKIVSSFGGTLCLVVSFVYNTSFVALLAVPEFALLRKASPPFSAVAGAVSALTLSLLLAGVPLFLAHRRVKTLEM
jgi:ABC-2 type transport system permease protein